MSASLITTLAGVLGGLAGVAALLNAVFGRGKSRAEATQIITGTAVSMMSEFEADAKSARAEAAQVREELRAVRDEARALADELIRIRTAIMRPDVTVEMLRAMATEGARNGRAH